MDGESSEGNTIARIFDSLDAGNQEILFLLATVIFDRNARQDSVKELALRIAPLVVHFPQYKSLWTYVDGIIHDAISIEAAA